MPPAPCCQIRFGGLRSDAESPRKGEAVPRLDRKSLYDTRIYYLVQFTGGQKENNNQIQSLSVMQGCEVLINSVADFV